MIEFNKMHTKKDMQLGLKEAVIVGQEVLAIFHNGRDQEAVEVIACWEQGKLKTIGDNGFESCFKWNKSAINALRAIAEETITKIKATKVA